MVEVGLEALPMSSSVTVSDVARAVLELPTNLLDCDKLLSFVCYAQRSPEPPAGFVLAQALDTNSLVLRDNALCIRDSYAQCQESRANGDAVGGDYAGRTMKKGVQLRGR